MVATIIHGLIYLCLLVMVFYLVLYIVRDVLNIPIPEKVIQILWVVLGLLVLLWIITNVLPSMGVRMGAIETTQEMLS